MNRYDNKCISIYNILDEIAKSNSLLNDKINMGGSLAEPLTCAAKKINTIYSNKEISTKDLVYVEFIT